SQHPDRGPCGTPEHGTGLACKGRYLPPGVSGQPPTRQDRATYSRGPDGRRLRARDRRPVAPDAATCLPALAPCETVVVPDKTATGQTAPGPALVSRRPADTTHVPGCKRAL